MNRGFLKPSSFYYNHHHHHHHQTQHPSPLDTAKLSSVLSFVTDIRSSKCTDMFAYASQHPDHPASPAQVCWYLHNSREQVFTFIVYELIFIYIYACVFPFCAWITPQVFFYLLTLIQHI